MNNDVACICKISAAVLFVFAFISAVILGNILSTVKYGYESFNFTVFSGVVIASFLTCPLLYAVGEIILHLNMSNHYASEQHDLRKKH